MPKTLIKFNLDSASESTSDAFQLECSTGTFSDSFQLSMTKYTSISIHITVGAWLYWILENALQKIHTLDLILDNN